MRRKWSSMILVALLVFGRLATIPTEIVRAAGEMEVTDGSVALKEVDESVGEMVQQTKGEFLQSGSSRIVRNGTGKITVGGTTIAQKQVSKVQVSVIVERLVNGSWLRYTAWSASKTNAYSVATSKTLTVPRGYSYRVRSIHNANSDRGHSNTGALYVD